MGDVSEKVVCFNFHEKATGKRLFPPSVILERGGVRIAFVGVTEPTTTTRQAAAEVAGLDSTRMDGLREFVKDLKARERPWSRGAKPPSAPCGCHCDLVAFGRLLM